MFKKFLEQAKKRFQPEKGLIADTYIVEGESFLTHKYQDNICRLKKVFENCSDVVFRNILLQMDKVTAAALVYLDGMVDRTTLHENIIKPLMDLKTEDYPKELSPNHRLSRVKSIDLMVGEVVEERDMYKLVNAVLSGDVIVLLDGADQALLVSCKGWKSRGISEPASESLIRGPRDSFDETLRSNTTLIRRRLKDPNLKIKMVKTGKKTNTDVAIMYLQGVAKDELLKEVEKRLATVNLDGVFESGYIEEFIEDNPYSPFPQIVITERPDRVAANLLEGRIAIVVDGTPMVIIAPATFTQFIQSPEDYYERAIFGSAVRIVRLLSFVVATTATSLYVALVAFHQYLIPGEIVLSVAQTRAGVPFPTIIEALFMEMVIELLREASIRLPGSIGQVIGIVGALVIGQSAVEANLASPILIIIVAISAISSYVVPQFSTSYAIRFARFPVILGAGLFGAFGIAMAWIWLLIHLCSLESFGEPYLAGIAPFRWSDVKDIFVRVPLWLMGSRPGSPATEDKDRLLRQEGEQDDDSRQEK